jgi:hypothetical protein
MLEAKRLDVAEVAEARSRTSDSYALQTHAGCTVADREARVEMTRCHDFDLFVTSHRVLYEVFATTIGLS